VGQSLNTQTTLKGKSKTKDELKNERALITPKRGTETITRMDVTREKIGGMEKNKR